MAFADNRPATAVNQVATSFSSDKSIAALSTAQATGTNPVVTVTDGMVRKSLKIIPPTDCLLRLVSAGSGVGGVPLFGGIANEFSGPDCPAGPLYITGLPTGAALTIWEG